jgi:hypothetical protein
MFLSKRNPENTDRHREKETGNEIKYNPVIASD